MMRLDPALSDEGPNGEESVTTVDLEKAMRQESRQLELPLEDRGEAPKVEGSGEAGTVAHGDERSGSEHLLMEEVVGRANLVGALKRVRQNKGSPGIDGMSVEELPEYLRRHWGEIRRSSPELCVKVRGSSSMLRLGCLGDLLGFEKREIEVAAFAPDRSSLQSNRGDEAERTGSVGEGAGAPDPTLDLGVQALEAVRGA